jgi:hypothetical protein
MLLLLLLLLPLLPLLLCPCNERLLVERHQLDSDPPRDM